MTKLKLVNDYQKRIEKNPNGGGEYQFYGIPNDEEGNLFIKLARKYLNRKLYRTVKYGRSNGSYYHNADKDKVDSFVLYIKDKPKKFQITYKAKPSFVTQIMEFESMEDATKWVEMVSYKDKDPKENAYRITEIE
jgi:hypothetical protein|tara:strand:+ start:60 stop:464 length:405 start_codon:yes stop_codon:yes gene_type:complete